MKLTTKFSVIFILIFGAGLAGAGYICRYFLLENARAQVLQEAHLMLESSLATRKYTSKNIKPLITSLRPHDKVFHKETVPAFAATQHFSYLRQQFPDYSYKEPTLIPTNELDAPADWERDIIQYFRDHPSASEYYNERDAATGRVLYLAKPVNVDMTCLDCHSTPDKAPAAMVNEYGRERGFGWEAGKVIGAFSSPMALRSPAEVKQSARAAIPCAAARGAAS